MKQRFSFLFLLSFIAAAVLFGSSCASIVPPSGGPKDTLPPQLLNATPPDSTLNFSADKVVFTFNEYVDLQNVQGNLLFSPLFTTNPKVEVKGKTISVKFQDTLEPNTTYILNFGNTIKDYTEGNVLPKFVYTFSTGTALDSLEISGKVQLAETGKTDSTLIVMLYKNLADSAVYKERPMYATRVDAAGNFRFQHLPPGTFAIYALGDAGTTRRYLNPSQLFAFANTPVRSASAADSGILLYAYRQVPKPTSAPPAPTASKKENRLIYTTNLTNDRQDLNENFEMRFAVPLKRFDTAKLALFADSSFTPVAYTTLLDSNQKTLTVATKWQPGTQYHLFLDQDFATDTLGRQLLKADTLSFTTKNTTDYGNVTITLKNLDTSLHPILQFVQNDKVVFAAAVPASGIFSANLFAPGDYELRILYDTNHNGRWDAGHFLPNRQQPEVVLALPGNITVKAGADNKFDR